MSIVPKAILYYDPNSVWSKSAILALEEKGYGDDEVERKVVDILKGENLSMTFLRISQKGLVPSLVVPLETSLSTEDEHRYKAITDVKSLLEFLDKSRSAISRTHTTSHAPAPSLTPATISQASTSNTIISVIHTIEADPDHLTFYNAVDKESLRSLSSAHTGALQAKLRMINSLITASQNAPVSASERTRKLWNEQKAQTETLLAVYSQASEADEELSSDEKDAREQYFKEVEDIWQVQLRGALDVIDKEFIGPYTLGDQLSITDLHLGPWLAQVASLLDCTNADSGDEVVARLETRIGNQFTFPKEFQLMAVPDLHTNPTQEVSLGEKRAKLAVFWDMVRARQSWKKVYANGQ